MSDAHKGKSLKNGIVVPGPNPSGANDRMVHPEDDGLHIVEFRKGDFEWWYFDIIDQLSGCFLKIVMHIGTDPLKTRIFPQIAISVNTPEKSESFSCAYGISDLQADTQQCKLAIKDAIKIWASFNNHAEYFIKIDILRFKCNFRFAGEIEGWKPLGKETNYHIGKKKSTFAWIIPLPKAQVQGDFQYENKQYTIDNAIGYHDHNYIRVDAKHPLHLDDLVIKWYWGKCYTDRFTVIFMDTLCRTNRTLSLLVAENNKIIHSSNNLMECSVLSFGYDNILQVKYPITLIIKSNDEHFHFQADFELVKISDRKDLLDGVNPFLKLLIKRLIAKPAYHGILTKVNLKVNDYFQEGYGNIESMVFREK
jgi:hypothetical protein